jgi:hypothetical protein
MVLNPVLTELLKQLIARVKGAGGLADSKAAGLRDKDSYQFRFLVSAPIHAALVHRVQGTVPATQHGQSISGDSVRDNPEDHTANILVSTVGPKLQIS